MEKDKNTIHETVEDNIVKNKASESSDAKKDSKPEDIKDKATDNAANKTEDKADSNKEGLKDSEIIDINKEEAEPTSKQSKVKHIPEPHKIRGKKSFKSTEDFIKNQKKRKKQRNLIILAIIAVLIFAVAMYIKSKVGEAKKALEELAKNSYQTAEVERKTLYDSKNATGTLYSLESRTLSRILNNTGNGGAEIVAVNVAVGDHVEAGDVLVEFSSENIEKSIAEKKEDIGTQKKLDAIQAERTQREYVNKYNDVADEISDAAEKVERALRALHEACDGYGDAKRERDDAKDYKDRKDYYDTLVYNALMKQESAQRDYDDAVEAQAKVLSKGSSSSLSEADASYQESQIKAGNSVKSLQRELNKSIDSLDDYVVHATISGVVTEVNVSEGNTFSSGNVLTIQDDSGYKAEVLVDEYDIPKVKKAYERAKAEGTDLEVVVKTEATEEKEYKGHVTAIAPTSTTTTAIVTVASSSGGSAAAVTGTASTANYKVSIELDEVDDAFMIGMSAKVAIVVEKAENALCVPYNCIEEKEDGSCVVRVIDEKGTISVYGNDMMGNMAAGKFGAESAESSEGKANGVNGIVIENDTDSTDAKKGRNNDKKGIASLISKLKGDNKKDEEKPDDVPKYREVNVNKIFDTDYYVAIEPFNPDEIKEGDTIMVVTGKSDGSDVMAMFGGGARQPGGPR